MHSVGHRYRVNGIDLNVVIEGAGPPVLLVHGFPDSHAVWRHQIPALVAAGYRVIAPDTRGCGDSDAPPGRSHYRIDVLVADLAALLDALHIDKVRLVAHDWGAMVAWHFCFQHPSRVDRYMALSVGHPSAYAGAPFEQKVKAYYILVFQLTGLAEWALRLSNWWLFRLMIRYDAEFPHWVAALSRPGRLTAALNYYRANIGMLFPKRWPAVTVPVMGVWSGGDRFLCEAQMSETQRYVQAAWRYERIDGANHWMQLTAADRVNELMLDFLR